MLSLSRHARRSLLWLHLLVLLSLFINSPGRDHHASIHLGRVRCAADAEEVLRAQVAVVVHGPETCGAAGEAAASRERVHDEVMEVRRVRRRRGFCCPVGAPASSLAAAVGGAETDRAEQRAGAGVGARRRAHLGWAAFIRSAVAEFCGGPADGDELYREGVKPPLMRQPWLPTDAITPPWWVLLPPPLPLNWSWMIRRRASWPPAEPPSLPMPAQGMPEVQQVAVGRHCCCPAGAAMLLGELHHAMEGRLAVKQRHALAGPGVFTVLGEILSGRRSATAEEERRGGWRLRTKHGGCRPDQDDGMTWSNCTAYSLNRSDENPGSIGVLPACVRGENVKITLFKKCHQNRTEVYIQD